MSTAILSSRTTLTTTTTTSKTFRPSLETKKSSEDTFNIRLSKPGLSQVSAVELDRQIQKEQVLYMLDKTIAKLQIAVCLPRLLRREACFLKRYLEPQEIEFIQYVCGKCTGSTATNRSKIKGDSLTNSLSKVIGQINKYQPQQKRIKQSVIFNMGKPECCSSNPFMMQALEIIWENNELRNKILEDFKLIPENDCTILVDSIKSLRQVTHDRFSITAAQEKFQEKQLRKAWLANFEIENDINVVKLMMQKQREELEEKLKQKQLIVSKHLSEIEDVKSKVKEDIKYQIQSSEKAMFEHSHACELHRLDLVVEARYITQRYENLVLSHMAREKGLRAKRFKVETQLSNWYTKFDADIGERQAQFEKLTAGYEAEKAEMTALQEKFDEQEKEYEILRAEKEDEDKRIWEEKAYVYLINRSARKIQRYWRAYRQRKIERKNARKAEQMAKKGRKGGKANGKGKNKDKDKQKVETLTRAANPMAALDKKFGGGLLEDLKGEEFTKNNAAADLSE